MSEVVVFDSSLPSFPVRRSLCPESLYPVLGPGRGSGAFGCGVFGDGPGRVVPGIQEGNSLNTLSGRLAPFCHFCEMWDDTGERDGLDGVGRLLVVGEDSLREHHLHSVGREMVLQLGYVGCLLNHF